METTKPFDVLVAAFSALDSTELDNFKIHLRKETPVLCGVNAYEWARDGAG